MLPLHPSPELGLCLSGAGGFVNGRVWGIAIAAFIIRAESLCLAMAAATMTEPFILVIGYGNTLRSDDGVGYRVAEAIAEQVENRTLSQVRSRPVHQLMPELADEIAQAMAVLFVDAASPDLDLTEVQLQSITPAPAASPLGHSQGARSLLFLAQMLYGTVPVAYWILIPTKTMTFGETFSDQTQRGFSQALNLIHQLVNEILRNVHS